MKRNTLIAWLLITLLAVPVFATGPADPLQSLPKGVYQLLAQNDFFDYYELSTDLNPYFQRADFTGDGIVDIALCVRGKLSGKNGIVFIHQQEGFYHLIGAGLDMGSWGDDFTWLKRWQVVPRSWNRPGVEALVLGHNEQNHAMVFWSEDHYTIKSMEVYHYYSDDPEQARSVMLPDLSAADISQELDR